MKIRDKSSTKSHFYERGFSLIEMMISITIGLLVIAALVGVLLSNSRTAKTNDRTSELQSNGRYALNHLAREIRMASYRAYTWAEPTYPLSTSITPPANECLDGGAAAGSFVTNLRQGIWGANDANPFSANCITSDVDHYVGDDVLAVRRTSVNSTADSTLRANTFYFRSSFAVGEVFQGITPPVLDPTLVRNINMVTNYQLQEYVYYIGKDDEDKTLPALRRIALKGNGEDCKGTVSSNALMCDEMVASRIEHMQVQFGRYTTDKNTQYYDADAITGNATSPLQTDWDEVNSVRIWLLARSAKIEPGYTNTNTYYMGGQPFIKNDGYRRQLFTAVVQLRN